MEGIAEFSTILDRCKEEKRWAGRASPGHVPTFALRHPLWSSAAGVTVEPHLKIRIDRTSIYFENTALFWEHERPANQLLRHEVSHGARL